MAAWSKAYERPPHLSLQAVAALIDYIQSLGAAGYGVFAALMITLQVRAHNTHDTEEVW